MQDFKLIKSSLHCDCDDQNKNQIYQLFSLFQSTDCLELYFLLLLTIYHVENWVIKIKFFLFKLIFLLKLRFWINWITRNYFTNIYPQRLSNSNWIFKDLI